MGQGTEAAHVYSGTDDAEMTYTIRSNQVPVSVESRLYGADLRTDSSHVAFFENVDLVPSLWQHTVTSIRLGRPRNVTFGMGLEVLSYLELYTSCPYRPFSINPCLGIARKSTIQLIS